MRIGSIIQLTVNSPYTPATPLPRPSKSILASPRPLYGESTTLVKVSKTGAGYVFYPESEYRCRQCWKFIENQQRCAELGLGDVIRPNGYCTMWSYGSPRPGLTPLGSYTKEQAGYDELENGTQCKNCEYFNGSNACKKVEGVIQPGGCCNNQTPK